MLKENSSKPEKPNDSYLFNDFMNECFGWVPLVWFQRKDMYFDDPKMNTWKLYLSVIKHCL